MSYNTQSQMVSYMLMRNENGSSLKRAVGIENNADIGLVGEATP